MVTEYQSQVTVTQYQSLMNQPHPLNKNQEPDRHDRVILRETERDIIPMNHWIYESDRIHRVVELGRRSESMGREVRSLQT